MKNILALPFLLLFVAFLQIVVKGNDNVIHWVYREQKDTHVNNTVQYFVRENGSLTVHTIKNIKMTCTTPENENENKNNNKQNKPKPRNIRTRLSSPNASSTEVNPLFSSNNNSIVGSPNSSIEELDSPVNEHELLDTSENRTHNKVYSSKNTDTYKAINTNGDINNFSNTRHTIKYIGDFLCKKIPFELSFAKESMVCKQVKKNKIITFSLTKYNVDEDMIDESFQLLKKYPREVTLENIEDLKKHKHVQHTSDKRTLKNSNNNEDKYNTKSDTKSNASNTKNDKDSLDDGNHKFLDDLIDEIVKAYLGKKDEVCLNYKNDKTVFKKNDKRNSPETDDKDEANEENKEINITIESLKKLSSDILKNGIKISNDETHTEKNDLTVSANPSFLNVDNKIASKAKVNTSVKKIEKKEEDDEEEEEEEEEDEEEEDEEDEEEEEDEEDEEELNDGRGEEDEDDGEETDNGEEETLTNVDDVETDKLKLDIGKIKKKYGKNFVDLSTGENESTVYQVKVLEHLTNTVKHEKPNINKSLQEREEADGVNPHKEDASERFADANKRKIENFRIYEEEKLNEIRKDKKKINELIDKDLNTLLIPAQKEYLKLARKTRNKLVKEYQNIIREEMEEP